MITRNHFIEFIKKANAASTAGKLIAQFLGKGFSRNGAMRGAMKHLLQKGDFAAAARVEGQRTAEQIARLAAKGKIPHAPVRNDGLIEVWKHPAAAARGHAITNAKQFRELQHMAMGQKPTVATNYLTQNMSPAYKKLYGVSDQMGPMPKFDRMSTFQNFEHGATGGWNGITPVTQPYSTMLPMRQIGHPNIL